MHLSTSALTIPQAFGQFRLICAAYSTGLYTWVPRMTCRVLSRGCTRDTKLSPATTRPARPQTRRAVSPACGTLARSPWGGGTRYAPKLENVGAGQECLRRPARQLRAVVLELGREDSAALRVQALPPVDAGELPSRRGPTWRRRTPSATRQHSPIAVVARPEKRARTRESYSLSARMVMNESCWPPCWTASTSHRTMIEVSPRSKRRYR